MCPGGNEAGPGPTGSPSPPPLSPPLPKIQPLEPDSPTGLPETPTPTADKLFAPRESDTLFYHAPPLSAITFKRQFNVSSRESCKTVRRGDLRGLERKYKTLQKALPSSLHPVQLPPPVPSATSW